MQRRAAVRLFEAVYARAAAAEASTGLVPCGATVRTAAAPALLEAYYLPGATGAAAAAAAVVAAGLAARSFSSAASPTAKSTANVPLGHHDSDLSSVACHIGLGRRRDLTMREDLGLWKNGSTRVKLADVFRGAKSLLVGFPGGKVCTEKHIPGYVAAVPELKAAGVDKVVCVTVGDPEQVEKWAKDNGFDKDATLCVLADKDQGFMRLLGLELGPTGPGCQRFAGVVDNGILLRLKVEATPGDLKHSQASAMLREFRSFFPGN